MKKTTKQMIPYLFIGLFFAGLLVAIPALAQDYVLLQPEVIGGSEGETSNLLDYAAAAITTILVIATVLSIVIFTWAGIEYMVSGIPGIKADAKSRMSAAFFGLLIALTAWLILNTINPNLINLSLDFGGRAGTISTDVAVNTGSGSSGQDDITAIPGDGSSLGEGVYGPVPSNEFEVRNRLKRRGILINDEGACRPDNLSACRTYVGNLNQNQINGVVGLSQECNCEIVITGAGEQGGHSVGSNHYTGTAVDIRSTNNFDNFMNRTIAEGGLGDLGINGNRLIYEGDHWHIEF
ncbi:MAG: pilin [Candidatus Paceibacterota bacterium]